MKLTFVGSDPDRERQAMYNAIYEEVYKDAAFDFMLHLDVTGRAREGKDAEAYRFALEQAARFFAQVCDDEEWESGILSAYIDRFR